MYGIQNTVELLEYNDIFGPRYKMYKVFEKEQTDCNLIQFIG